MKAPSIIENQQALTFELQSRAEAQDPVALIDLSDGSFGSCGFSYQLLQYAEPGFSETSANLGKPFSAFERGPGLVVSLLDAEDEGTYEFAYLMIPDGIYG